MLGWSHRFLGIISTFLGSKCALLKDTTRFDPSSFGPDITIFHTDLDGARQVSWLMVRAFSLSGIDDVIFFLNFIK